MTTTTSRLLRERRILAGTRLRSALAGLDRRSDTGANMAVETALQDVAQYAAWQRELDSPEARAALSPYSTPHGAGFFADLRRARTVGGVPADPEAMARLDQHRAAFADAASELRAGGKSSDFNSLVVPAYLLDMLAPAPHSPRALTNLLSIPAPEKGMHIEIPKVTNGMTAEVQTAELAALSGTDVTVGNIDGTYGNVALTFNLPIQILERATAGYDRLVGVEVMAAYGQRVEAQVVNGSGVSGQQTGIFNTSGVISVTYTDATPTAAEFLPKVGAALTAHFNSRKLTADTIVMAPRRWLWLLSRGEGALIGQVEATPPAGAHPSVVGRILGTDVVLSPEVPTNLGVGTDQDAVAVFRRSDVYVGETPPVVAVQGDFAGTTGVVVRFEISDYLSINPKYPESLVILGGTGLNAVAS